MAALEKQSLITKVFKNTFLKKFTQWEYWPSYMFYIPNLPYALYLTIKGHDLTLYSAVNPSIKNSGNGTESKYKTLELIPDLLKPKSVFVSKERNFDEIIKQLHQKGIDYPIIAKPDIGFKGLLVKKIYSDKELSTYLKTFPIDLILQEFIGLPNECGIFYHRLPNSDKGMVSSFTLKSFLSVKGDGISNLSELVLFDKRAQHYIEMLKRNHKKIWLSIPEKDQIILLSDIGNHARGTQFINGNHLIDQKLTDMLDQLSGKIKGWYYGRLDVKYNTIEELKEGKKFIILEINGTIAEATHMYDPYHTTYFKALKTIRQHWKYLYKIAKQNLKNGVPSEKFTTYWKETYKLIRYVKKVKKLAKSTS